MSESYEYYTKFGWEQNPFTLKISPSLMVGYSSQTDELLSHVFNSHKMAIVIGHTGSGKTTLMNWLNDYINNNKDSFTSHYIPKCPRTKEDMIALFKFLFGYNIIDNFRFRSLSTQNLPRFLVKKTSNNKNVVLVDEAHETSIEVLEWLRTLNDMVPNLLIIFAGLPVFEKKLETELPTLYMRITTKTYLESLNYVETESLIRRRIEDSNGDGLKPFTSEAVKKVFEISGGFPREIIKLCDKLIEGASKNNIPAINGLFVEQMVSSEVPKEKIVAHKQQKPDVSISSKQKNILRIINKNPSLNPSQIVRKMDTDSYKNKNNAVRSVNNILRRLMEEGLVQREKSGNTYIYSLTGKSRSIFAEA
ncbi:MAG: AAA family ATPase [Candidatus Aenigmarchaeota archaeon]|nr:AAA family ATPase [Candidatus Aenigmarchaeota archaeon]